MRWRTPLFLGAAVLAAAGAISAFIAFGAPGGDDELTVPTPIPEALRGLGHHGTIEITATRTPIPEWLRGLGPPGTIEITTPAPLTPTPAAEAGRPDCPQDWAAYSDPDGYFSICYPSDFFALVSEPQAYFGHTLSFYSVQPPAPLPSDGILLTIYWSESGTPDLGSTIDTCDPVSYWRDVKQMSLTLTERTVQACAGDKTGIAYHGKGTPPPYRGTFAEIPVGPDEGYIVFFLTESGESSKIDGEPLSSIFRSLRVGQ